MNLFFPPSTGVLINPTAHQEYWRLFLRSTMVTMRQWSFFYI